MEIKDVLKSLRKSNGFKTMQDFCEESGISFSTYQNYETGRRVPTVEILVKIADFYGVTTDYLLGREPAPDPFAAFDVTAETEEDVIKKYMSFPPAIRACLMDILIQLGDAAKSRPAEEDSMAVSTTLGNIEDDMDKTAILKEGA